MFLGSGARGTPLFELPGEFYAAVFSRIKTLFGPNAVDDAEERIVVYGVRAFAVSITTPSAEHCGASLSIRAAGVDQANTKDAG